MKPNLNSLPCIQCGEAAQFNKACYGWSACCSNPKCPASHGVLQAGTKKAILGFWNERQAQSPNRPLEILPCSGCQQMPHVLESDLMKRWELRCHSSKCPEYYRCWAKADRVEAVRAWNDYHIKAAAVPNLNLEGAISTQEYKEVIRENNPDVIFFTDLDDALIGMANRCGQPTLAVYDFDRIIEIRIADGMTREEALDFTSFNTESAWIDEHTPLIFHKKSL